MQPDLLLRAAARAIYDACYPSEEWAPYPLEQAERFGTIHYRNAIFFPYYPTDNNRQIGGYSAMYP